MKRTVTLLIILIILGVIAGGIGLMQTLSRSKPAENTAQSFFEQK